MGSGALPLAGIGERDLEFAIRKAGGTEVDNVKLATIERGGSIQVVLKE